MKRSTFVMFGLAALLFAVLIPAWAISREGGEEASPQNVPADLEQGKDLFVTNCGSCHTLYKAGTDGVVGPDLDEILGPPTPAEPSSEQIEGTKTRVQTVIETGSQGKMPAGILSGPQAEEVASFVAQVAGDR